MIDYFGCVVISLISLRACFTFGQCFQAPVRRDQRVLRGEPRSSVWLPGEAQFFNGRLEEESSTPREKGGGFSGGAGGEGRSGSRLPRRARENISTALNRTNRV
jgi:hypothetical protein